MKKTNRTLSVLLAATVLATALTGCGWLDKMPEKLELSMIGEGSGSGELVTTGSGAYAAEDVDAIEVKGEALAIYVTRSDSGQAEVELLLDRQIHNKVTFKSELKKGTLQLDVKENSRTIGDDQRGERRLNIALPEKVYDRLRVTNAFGRIEVQEIAAERVEVKLDAGQIVLDRVTGEIDARTEAGEIVMQGLDLKDDVTAKTSVGKVTVGLIESPAAVRVSLGSELGSVRSELEGLDIQEQSGRKLVGAIGSDGPKLTLQSEVGEVELKLER